MVEMKGKYKPLPPPKRKYSKTKMEAANTQSLMKLCIKKRVPYASLTKVEIIENILSWQEGKGIVHLAKRTTWAEAGEYGHTVGYRHKRFAFVMATKYMSRADLAKQFDVSIRTIDQWLIWPEIKDLIEQYQTNQEERVLQLLEQEQEMAIEELTNIIKAKKTPADIRRKAIVDLLGFAGRKNANTSKVNIKQISATQENNYNMTDSELVNELKELRVLNSKELIRMHGINRSGQNKIG